MKTTQFKPFSYMPSLPSIKRLMWMDKLFRGRTVRAQSTGLEMIVMDDVKFDYQTCTNNKWHNLVQLFDLTQLVTETIRTTPSPLTIIDHIYTTDTQFCTIHSISDRFPVCFSRETSSKIFKNEHIATTYLWSSVYAWSGCLYGAIQ